MQVSSRARLAWANRNIEAAADIIVAEYLRVAAKQINELSEGYVTADDIADSFNGTARTLDPKGEK